MNIERQKNLLSLGLTLMLLVLTVRASVASGAPKPYYTDRGQFNYARFLLNDGDFALAAKEFERVVESFPGSPLLAEAQLLGAEAYLEAGSFREAEVNLRLFLSNYSGTPLGVRARELLAEVESRRQPVAAAPEPPGVRPPSPGGMRAVQVALFGGLGLEEIGVELERLKASGIDTVIVRVFHNRGDRYYSAAGETAGTGVPAGVYFNTSHAPVVADLLTPFVEMAHASGLRIYAWMTTRYADYGMEERDACVGYDLASGGYTRCRGLDIFNERAVEHIEALYADLAEYALDGILFQDDLVLRHTEGFGPEAARLFKEETGRTLDPAGLYVVDGERVHYTPRFWQWAEWKNRRLLYVASRVKAVVRARRPGVKFAINLMYESVTNPPYSLAWLSQDLAGAMREGFDYYAIMAYHRQMSEELGKDPAFIQALIERMAVEAASTVGDPGKVLIKLQTIDWSTGLPLSNGEVVGLIRGVVGGGVSLAVVPYRGDFPFYELARGHGYASLE